MEKYNIYNPLYKRCSPWIVTILSARPARYSGSPSSPSGGGIRRGRYNGLVRGKSLTSAQREDTAAIARLPCASSWASRRLPYPMAGRSSFTPVSPAGKKKGDLLNQVQALKQFCKGRGQPYHDVWTDIGSGLNFSLPEVPPTLH
jgi:hypothetical protein